MKSKEKRNRFYRISAELSSQAKATFANANPDDLESTLGAYLGLLQPIKEDELDDTVEVTKYTLQQMALLASGPLARIIAKRN